MLRESRRERGAQRGRQSAEIENGAFHCHICCCIDSRIVHSIDSAFKSRAETIMAALSPFSTRTGDKTTHGSSQSTGRTALVAIEVFVVMGMNRIDKGMNRARTVGGALHGTMEWLAGMAWRHQIGRETEERIEGTRQTASSFISEMNLLLFPVFTRPTRFAFLQSACPGRGGAQEEEGMGRISITDLT